MEKYIGRTLVGWLVSLIIGWVVYAASFQGSGISFGEWLLFGVLLGFIQVVQIFFISIVCTLGISLIIWIPLGYGVGSIVYYLGGWNKQVTDDSQQLDPALTKGQRALLKYISSARVKGLSDDQISQNLTNNGWNIDSIKDAFQMAAPGSWAS